MATEDVAVKEFLERDQEERDPRLTNTKSRTQNSLGKTVNYDYVY
jgi:hypothetical protein